MTPTEFYKKYGTTPKELNRLIKVYNELWLEKQNKGTYKISAKKIIKPYNDK